MIDAVFGRFAAAYTPENLKRCADIFGVSMKEMSDAVVDAQKRGRLSIPAKFFSAEIKDGKIDVHGLKEELEK